MAVTLKIHLSYTEKLITAMKSIISLDITMFSHINMAIYLSKCFKVLHIKWIW
jgi:acyl-ACP thioesterase